MNDLELRASKIKLAAFDVDGVMTDGSITYDENGVEYWDARELQIVLDYKEWRKFANT